MKQIRKGVFETNSSSTHSVTIGKGNTVPSELEIIEYCDIGDYEDTIIIDTVGFCGMYDHQSQSDKLAYIMQQIAYINGFFELFWAPANMEELLADYYECDNCGWHDLGY